jgi:hypothetical protein
MKNKTKEIIKKIPLGNVASKGILSNLNNRFFPGSKEYWEERYSRGRTSGVGSYGKFAEFKAEIINAFVKENDINSVIEFGCGDGNQLSLFDFPSYIGLDVSRTSIKLCMERFKTDKTKSFFLYDSEYYKDNHSIFKAELTLSLDVIYHLIEYNIFDLYMNHLFSSSDRFVIIYSDDIETKQKYHEKHRQFSKWIETNLSEWKLINKIKNRYPNESCSDFFIYKKI